MKVIIINTPDGQYSLPLVKVAENRAYYYAVIVDKKTIDSKEYKEEVLYVLNNSSEGIDWLLNNADYEHWEDQTTKINNDVKVTHDNFWTRTSDFEIKEIE